MPVRPAAHLVLITSQNSNRDKLFSLFWWQRHRREFIRSAGKSKPSCPSNSTYLCAVCRNLSVWLHLVRALALLQFAHNWPEATALPGGTSAPGHHGNISTTAPSSTIAPIPTKLLSCRVRHDNSAMTNCDIFTDDSWQCSRINMHH